MSKIRWLLAALGVAVIGLVPVVAANSSAAPSGVNNTMGRFGGRSGWPS